MLPPNRWPVSVAELPIYVVSVTTFAERHRHMNAQAEKYGLKLEYLWRFDADAFRCDHSTECRADLARVLFDVHDAIEAFVNGEGVLDVRADDRGETLVEFLHAASESGLVRGAERDAGSKSTRVDWCELSSFSLPADRDAIQGTFQRDLDRAIRDWHVRIQFEADAFRLLPHAR